MVFGKVIKFRIFFCFVLKTVFVVVLFCFFTIFLWGVGILNEPEFLGRDRGA